MNKVDRKSSQVNASVRKPWPNGVASRSKFSTCVSVWPGLYAKARSSIVSYVGGNIPVLGTVKLQVWKGSFTCLLLCRLVESKRSRPILSKSACEVLGVIEIKDSDAIRRPDTSGGHVFSVKDVMSSSRPLTKEQVQIEMFPDVFDEGLGLLEGEYHIRLNDSAKPVQHAPRRG